MSKSMGNIIPLRQAIRHYGADPIRLAIIISAELLQDADFNVESINGIQHRLEVLLEECSKLKHSKIGEMSSEDRWIASKLYRMVSDVSGSIEKMRLREALHDILFAFESDISWYCKRAEAKGNQNVSAMMYNINCTRVLMLSPFAPHVAEGNVGESRL